MLSAEKRPTDCGCYRKNNSAVATCCKSQKCVCKNDYRENIK